VYGRQRSAFAITHHFPQGANYRLSQAWLRGSARGLWIASTVGLAYYLGTKLGFFLTPHGKAIAAFWPPNAILLAAFLLLAPRFWGGVIAAVLVAHLLAQGESGVPLSTTLGWFVGNVSEALLGATLLYRFSNRKSLFDSVRGTVMFLLLGVFLAPFATSFLDAAVVVITHWGRDYWLLWLTRLFSNMLATLTFVPVIVALVTQRQSIRTARFSRHVEALTLIVLVTMVTIVAYGGHDPLPDIIPVLVYAPVSFLLWGVLRFGVGGLAISSALISFISLYNVMRGHGPFSERSLTENVLFMQILVATVTVPLMLLNAVLAERRRTQHRLQESNARLIEIQEVERKRIAGELHDDIGQQLSLLQLELQQARSVVEENPAQSKELLRLAESKVQTVSEAIHQLSHGLHPVQLDYLGLVGALGQLCSHIHNEAKMEVQFKEKRVPSDVPKDISLSLFRVAQEALHNVIKHSHASKVSVELRKEQNHIVLQIADNGRGLSLSDEQTGLGLVNMRERLESIGGTITFGPATGTGTNVEASVPLHRKP
jgi:two-component system sensor histidine kinase UhpB